MTSTYIAVDLETTGLDPKLDKIIEIGAVKVVDGVEKERFCSYVNPGRQVSERICALTGITNEMLKDAPDLDTIFPELEAFFTDEILLGHNLRFDYSFLKRAFVFRKKTFQRKGIDTLRISRVTLPELPSRKLGDLCEYYQIPLQAHRAFHDAKATSDLYLKLLTAFGTEEKYMTLFEPKELIYTVKKDSPATKAQKEQLGRLIAEHQLQIDYEIEKLTKSEASRKIDKIYSLFPRLKN